MALNSMQEIFEKAASRSIPFWRVVLETDMEERQVTEEQSMEKMRAAWHAMLESAVSYQGDQRSRSGLVGGDGAQMRRYAAAVHISYPLFFNHKLPGARVKLYACVVALIHLKQ